MTSLKKSNEYKYVIYDNYDKTLLHVGKVEMIRKMRDNNIYYVSFIARLDRDMNYIDKNDEGYYTTLDEFSRTGLKNVKLRRITEFHNFINSASYIEELKSRRDPIKNIPELKYEINRFETYYDIPNQYTKDYIDRESNLFNTYIRLNRIPDTYQFFYDNVAGVFTGIYPRGVFDIDLARMKAKNNLDMFYEIMENYKLYRQQIVRNPRILSGQILPLYRWNTIFKRFRKGDYFVQHLPFSTTFDFNFAIEWGKDNYCCLFIILTPLEYPMSILSNPNYKGSEQKYINQKQKEVLLPPSVLYIKQVSVVGGITVYVVEPKLIRENVIKSLLVDNEMSEDEFNDDLRDNPSSVIIENYKFPIDDKRNSGAGAGSSETVSPRRR